MTLLCTAVPPHSIIDTVAKTRPSRRIDVSYCAIQIVEPQMITRQRSGDWRSDCYSLGIILLEAAARQPLHRETIARELWRLWTGEHSWDGAPGLARIIEDLIDAQPDQRSRLWMLDRVHALLPLVACPLHHLMDREKVLETKKMLVR
jgi:hypothetical protein